MSKVCAVMVMVSMNVGLVKIPSMAAAIKAVIKLFMFYYFPVCMVYICYILLYSGWTISSQCPPGPCPFMAVLVFWRREVESKFISAANSARYCYSQKISNSQALPAFLCLDCLPSHGARLSSPELDGGRWCVLLVPLQVERSHPWPCPCFPFSLSSSSHSRNVRAGTRALE